MSSVSGHRLVHLLLLDLGKLLLDDTLSLVLTISTAGSLPTVLRYEQVLRMLGL